MSAPELVSGYVVAGKYIIRSLLLNGGAMATYRATGPKNRESAVKFYDPAILSFPAVLKTLAQHQSVSAKLPHQQVIPIAESGTDPNSGAPFTVTDFESAPSLAQLIDHGPLSASATVALIRNLARVTDLLHSNGVTNLSIHPGNVFVRSGAQYEVRVADFGGNLVRGALPVTERSARWMPWLAPEQIKGQAQPTEAADVFAVALMAFFAATGKRYWRSSQSKTVDAAALRREILGERMPASVRASEFSITLNPAIDVVFARALAFRPPDRYPTAGDFAAGLEAALLGRSVADAAAARPQAANVAAATAHAGETGPAAERASSTDEAMAGARRVAPAPRKMPHRATMLGMGSRSADEPIGQPGPRPPLNTMLGMGERAAEPPPTAPERGIAAAEATTPAKVAPPAMPTAPAKPPAMPTSSAKAARPVTTTAPAKPPALPTAVSNVVPMAPVITDMAAKAPSPAKLGVTAVMPTFAMPTAPAISLESPMVVPSATAQRGGPPPLPMPPPAALEKVLASFEAGPPQAAALPETTSPTFPVASTDVAQTTPAWSTAPRAEPGGERMETDAAIVGEHIAETHKHARLRWVVGACGLLVLMAGAALALSGGTSGSGDRAASDAKATTLPPNAAALPTPNEPPSENAAPPAAHPTVEEAPAVPAPMPPPPAPAPPAEEPQVAPPSAVAAPPPTASDPTGNKVAAQPAQPSAAAAPRGQPSPKPCGKFLKRCK
jgi:serine/threonine protein kinase